MVRLTKSEAKKISWVVAGLFLIYAYLLNQLLLGVLIFIIFAIIITLNSRR